MLEKKTKKNRHLYYFYEIDSAGQMCSLFAFLKYNIQLCKLFFIYYVFHLPWINKPIVTF